MRVLIFHGYLLGGTGSNVYNASLARAMRRMGHEVHLLCQDRAAGELDWVDYTGDWDEGELQIHAAGAEPAEGAGRIARKDPQRPRNAFVLTGRGYRGLQILRHRADFGVVCVGVQG